MASRSSSTDMDNLEAFSSGDRWTIECKINGRRSIRVRPGEVKVQVYISIEYDVMVNCYYCYHGYAVSIDVPSTRAQGF